MKDLSLAIARVVVITVAAHYISKAIFAAEVRYAEKKQKKAKK